MLKKIEVEMQSEKQVVRRLSKMALVLWVLPVVWVGLSFLMLTLSIAFLVRRSSPAPKVVASNYSLYLAEPRSSVLASATYASNDARPAILDKYFISQGAPLAGFGQQLVNAADKYELDWRLVAAIAMQESNGGKVMPPNSYNAWGWAIYTGQNSGWTFNGWEEAIEMVSRGMAVYRDKHGLVTPEEIMTRYSPDSLEKGGSWARGVHYFMNLFGRYYNQDES